MSNVLKGDHEKVTRLFMATYNAWADEAEAMTDEGVVPTLGDHVLALHSFGHAMVNALLSAVPPEYHEAHKEFVAEGFRASLGLESKMVGNVGWEPVQREEE